MEPLAEYRLLLYHTPLSCVCQYFCCNFFINFLLDFLCLTNCPKTQKKCGLVLTSLNYYAIIPLSPHERLTSFLHSDWKAKPPTKCRGFCLLISGHFFRFNIYCRRYEFSDERSRFYGLSATESVIECTLDRVV